MATCKFYTPHMKTVREYIDCLYQLEGCGAGGMLHIVTDDDNIEDEDILFCLKECLNHPEKEEAKIGKLICEEMLKLSRIQRTMLTVGAIPLGTCVDNDCDTCQYTCDYYGNSYLEDDNQ